MHDFHYREGKLCCEGVSLEEVADGVGTPVYVYSLKTLTDHFRKLARAFAALDHLICYSVKCNSNGAVLRALLNEGSGLDIVSGGELFRALQAGADPGKIVFAGVGKGDREVREAVEAGILFFTVESAQELHLLNEAGRSLGRGVPVALRVNPNVDPDTHRYTTTGKGGSKFGVGLDVAPGLYEKCLRLTNLEPVGVQMHIGSQITRTEPYVEAVSKVLPLLGEIRSMGIALRFFDIGGGMGIVYDDETPSTAEEFAAAVLPLLSGLGLKIVLEPGRFIAGNAGVLVTTVRFIKRSFGKTFVIVDGGMNDLIRPSLYGAHHAIRPLREREGERAVADVVGPVCETGDFFALDREITLPLPGERLALMGAGAYGFAMSSNYNSRPRAAEVMVKGEEFFVVRERESYEDLVRGETIPDFLTVD